MLFGFLSSFIYVACMQISFVYERMLAVHRKVLLLSTSISGALYLNGCAASSYWHPQPEWTIVFACVCVCSYSQSTPVSAALWHMYDVYRWPR